MHRRRHGSEQAHRVGAELPVLFGSAVRLGRAPVQAEHELQVLVRFLLVGERPVVRSAPVLGALLWLMMVVAPPAAPLMVGGHSPPCRRSGARATQQVDETGEDADTQ